MFRKFILVFIATFSNLQIVFTANLYLNNPFLPNVIPIGPPNHQPIETAADSNGQQLIYNNNIIKDPNNNVPNQLITSALINQLLGANANYNYGNVITSPGIQQQPPADGTATSGVIHVAPKQQAHNYNNNPFINNNGLNAIPAYPQTLPTVAPTVANYNNNPFLGNNGAIGHPQPPSYRPTVAPPVNPPSYNNNPFLIVHNATGPSGYKDIQSSYRPSLPTIGPPVGGDNSPKYTTTPPQNYGNLIKYCLKPRGQFPGKWCNSYVNCWDGVAIEQYCPDTLLFNSLKLYCDYASNVDCQGRPIGAYPTYPAQNDSSLVTIAAIITPPPVPVYFPTVPPSTPTTTSERPVNVASIVPTAKPVPPATFAPPTHVHPTYQPTDPPPTRNPGLLRKYCAKPRGQFPSKSCSKYINCWDDVVVEQDCPPGLLFSEKGYCDYPHNVVCKYGDNPIVHYHSLCPQGQGTFRDQADCSSYYVCSNNEVVARYKCPEGFKFSTEIGVCDFESRVNCGNVQSPVALIKKIPAALIDMTVKCVEGKVYPLNPQCTSVSVCRRNVAEIVHCPPGYAYDVATDKCLTLGLAKCL